jgi:hypothetical protein
MSKFILLIAMLFCFNTNAMAVDQRWKVKCSTHPVTDVKKCFMLTMGFRMNADGEPFGDADMPIKLMFLNKEGPFFIVGASTFPKRFPTVKVDHNKPIRFVDHADAGENALLLLKQLHSGDVLRGEYHVWPEGAQQVYVELDGFTETYHELMSHVGR